MQRPIALDGVAYSSSALVNHRFKPLLASDGVGPPMHAAAPKPWKQHGQMIEQSGLWLVPPPLGFNVLCNGPYCCLRSFDQLHLAWTTLLTRSLIIFYHNIHLLDSVTLRPDDARHRSARSPGERDVRIYDSRSPPVSRSQ
jgi:hypothetical protein